MSKRLQVILDDPEYRDLQRAARARRMSIAQWVREALAFAHQRQSTLSIEQKLEALNRASKYEFPIGDVEQLLTEIERGYLSSSEE
ncbi:MAG: antitoxin [Acidobacteria bacterium]|nr:antitoxin [Acidobacteriota bacterium]MBV9437275.1 antitoxin [Acidobacteriota bacterium]